MIYVMRDIPGWEDQYAVTPDGKIWSHKTNVWLTSIPTSSGYLKVCFSVSKNKKVNFEVHRAVALVWVKNPNNNPEVNHKDGNKLNNSHKNLEWVTRSNNQIHAFALGLRSTKRGEDSPAAKLTTIQVLEIHKDKRTQNRIAEEYGISQQQVSRIKTGKRWTASMVPS